MGIRPRPATSTPQGTLGAMSTGRRAVFDLFDEEDAHEREDLWTTMPCATPTSHGFSTMLIEHTPPSPSPGPREALRRSPRPLSLVARTETPTALTSRWSLNSNEPSPDSRSRSSDSQTLTTTCPDSGYSFGSSGGHQPHSDYLDNGPGTGGRPRSQTRPDPDEVESESPTLGYFSP